MSQFALQPSAVKQIIQWC